MELEDFWAGFADGPPSFFPLEFVRIPARPSSSSPRVLRRWRDKRELAGFANHVIKGLNLLYGPLPTVRAHEPSTRCVESIHKFILSRCKPLRRSPGSTGGEALRRLLRAADAYDTSATQPVFLTVPRVESVSEPRDSAGITMEEGCDPEFLEDYTPERLLVGGATPAPGAARFHGSAEAKVAYYRRVRDSGFFSFLRAGEVKCVNPLFFIYKSDGVRLRRIQNCVCNALFRECGDCPLPGPWVWARAQFAAPFVSAVADIEVAFTRVFLLEWLIPFFACPPVSAAQLCSAAELLAGGFADPVSGRWVDKAEWVFPASTRLPMGWRLSVPIMLHVALRASFAGWRAEAKLICLNRTGHDSGVIDVAEDEIVYGIYIDNLIVAGSQEALVNEVHGRIVENLNRHNLTCGADSVAKAQPVVDYVGLEINGSQRVVFPKGSRLRDISLACLYLASCRKWHAIVLERILGFLAWMFSLRRPLFVLLGALFQFCRVHRGKQAFGWPTARQELVAVARLVPLAAVSLAQPLAPIEIAQDAEGPSRVDAGGAGVVARVLPDAHGPPECGRVVAALEPDTEQWLGRAPWLPVLQRRWRFSEHIGLGEMHAILLWLQRVCLGACWHGRRIVVWIDSSCVHAVVRKGRGRSFSLNARFKKIAALLLAADIVLDVRWVPSALQPADGLSRWRGRPRWAAFARVPGAAGDTEVVSGGSASFSGMVSPF